MKKFAGRHQWLRLRVALLSLWWCLNVGNTNALVSRRVPHTEHSPSRLWTSKDSSSTVGNIAARQTKRSSSGDECRVATKRKARRRKPPYPSAAYPLAEEEAQLTHNYISFIDQSILKTYSQQTRLMEPRRYAIPDQFLKENANTPPTVDDVAMPTTNVSRAATLEMRSVCH